MDYQGWLGSLGVEVVLSLYLFFFVIDRTARLQKLALQRQDSLGAGFCACPHKE